MRPHYFCEFLLGETDTVPLPPVQDFAALCRTWLSKPRPGIEEPDLLPDELNTSGKSETHELSDTSRVQTLSFPGDQADHFALRLVHPNSSDDATITWTTEICFAADHRTNTAKVSVAIAVNQSAGIVKPLFTQPSRPAIVKQIVDRWGAREHFPIRTEPYPLVASNTSSFLDMLFCPQRRLPVLFISAKNIDDKPLIDGKVAADQLVGLCHVAVADSRFVSFHLRDDLGQMHNCWDGAIRIYWPGFKTTDAAYWHKLWTPDTVREMESHAGGFCRHALGLFARIGNVRHLYTEASWNFIERLLYQKAVKDLHDCGENAELVRWVEDENRRLTEANRNLQAELSDSRLEAERAQSEADSWRLAYVASQKASKGETADRMAIDSVPPTSVAEAVDRISQEYPDVIRFHLNSRSDVKNNPFEDCENVYEALRFLATTYYNARTGTAPRADLDAACREASGFFYEPNQSDVTIGMFEEYYTTQWNGKPLKLRSHVGKGTSKEARYCIRVAFEYDEDKKVVVIGYIGQHQKTRAT